MKTMLVMLVLLFAVSPAWAAGGGANHWQPDVKVGKITNHPQLVTPGSNRINGVVIPKAPHYDPLLLGTMTNTGNKTITLPYGSSISTTAKQAGPGSGKAPTGLYLGPQITLSPGQSVTVQEEFGSAGEPFFELY